MLKIHLQKRFLLPSILLIPLLLFGKPSHEKIFSNYYRIGEWDESGFSLSGSQLDITREYVEYLQEFLEENNIKTVVDLGCGDWAFSRYIDWTGIQYLGIDVVKDVIDRNQMKFAKPNIVFKHGNFSNMSLPEADLFLCKDVLQHFSNDDIRNVISLFPKYQHCLITNYIDHLFLLRNNHEIKPGEYHPIDLSLPPFKLKGEKVLDFFSGVAPKQTFYIRN